VDIPPFALHRRYVQSGLYAQCRPPLEPDGMSDDVRWEAVTGVGDGFIAHRL